MSPKLSAKPLNQQPDEVSNKELKMKNWRLIGLSLLLAITVAGCSKLTMENYDKLKVGMSYEEVKTIIGKPATCSELLVVKQCTWGDEKSGISANFMADKMVTHSANNLQ